MQQMRCAGDSGAKAGFGLAFPRGAKPQFIVTLNGFRLDRACDSFAGIFIGKLTHRLRCCASAC